MDDDTENLKQYKINKFRSMIAQISASLSTTVTMFNIAIVYSIIVVVNGELVRSPTSTNSEALTMTKTQSSWYSSQVHLVHLGGSFLAGCFQDYCGRKKCMLLCNIPLILGWITLFYANKTFDLYLSSILMGIGASFGEIPVATYVSEIASAKLRGRLFSFTKMGYGFGSLFVFALNNYLHWRTVALICILCPIISTCYLMMIPESPSWLISKGRHDEALHALRWLRGWTPANLVNEEFLKLQQYIKESKTLGQKSTNYMPVLTKNERNDGDNKNCSIFKKFVILREKEFLQPFKIVSILFLLSYTLSLRSVKPYLMNIYEQLGLQAGAKVILVTSSIAQILGAVTMIATINRIGKRRLIFYTFSISAACLAGIGIYAVLYTKYNFKDGRILFIISAIIFYLTGYAIGGMPWYLCGELYPQRIRGIASGISATMAQILIFILVKSFVELENIFGLAQVFFINSVIGISGTVYLYYCLPETENKSLEEIEKHIRNHNKTNESLKFNASNTERNDN